MSRPLIRIGIGLGRGFGDVGIDGAVAERDSSSIAAKVGEGYAKPSLFGNSDEARTVADDWNDAVDTRQVDIRVYAVFVAKIAQNLEATEAACEQVVKDLDETARGVAKDAQKKADDTKGSLRSRAGGEASGASEEELEKARKKVRDAARRSASRWTRRSTRSPTRTGRSS